MNLITVCNNQCSEQSFYCSDLTQEAFNQTPKEEEATQIAVQHFLGSTIQKTNQRLSLKTPGRLF